MVSSAIMLNEGKCFCSLFSQMPGVSATAGFVVRQGQPGYLIISHTTRRAGICFAEGRTEWGRWDEETGTITTDGGQRYDYAGEEVRDAVNQLLTPGEAHQLAEEP